MSPKCRSDKIILHEFMSKVNEIRWDIMEAYKMTFHIKENMYPNWFNLQRPKNFCSSFVSPSQNFQLLENFSFNFLFLSCFESTEAFHVYSTMQTFNFTVKWFTCFEMSSKWTFQKETIQIFNFASKYIWTFLDFI